MFEKPKMELLPKELWPWIVVALLVVNTLLLASMLCREEILRWLGFLEK